MYIIGYILLGFVFVVAIGVLILLGRFLFLFNYRPCPHCSHTMRFRGEKERTSGNIYLFHCPNCGAWEEVPKKKLDAQLYDNTSDLNNM